MNSSLVNHCSDLVYWWCETGLMGILFTTLDSGLIVPSIPLTLRDKLLATAASLGFTFDRQNELFGRAASDMILQLLGGSHRYLIS